MAVHSHAHPQASLSFNEGQRPPKKLRSPSLMTLEENDGATVTDSQ